MKKTYSTNNIKQLFLAILPAQIFSSVTDSLSGIVNGLIIGKYLSNLDMIALGFEMPLSTIVSVVPSVVSAGARVLCGNYIGRGQKEKVNQTFTNAIRILVVLGIMITTTGLLFSNQIASIIASEEALEKTAMYIRGSAIGSIPSVLIPCLMVFLQMENEGRYALIATAFLAIVNLVLSLGAMNFIGIDIFGVGLITSISEIVTLIFILIKFYKNKSLPRYNNKYKIEIKDIILFGLPSGLAGLLYALRNSTLNTFTSNTYGSDAVNALSILVSSAGPFDGINIGVGQAALMLASIYVGEKDSDALVTLAKTAIRVGIILATAKVAIIFAFAGSLADVFGAIESVRPLTIDLYKAYSLSMPLNIIALAIINSYQALGKITYCNIITIISAYVFPIAFAYLGNSFLGINSIWYCYPFAEIAVIMIVYFVACIKKRHIITSLSEIICLDSNLEIKSRMTISIRTIQEVEEVSKKIQSYCLSENISKNKSYIAGLCSEEIAVNIIEHGFTKSKKKHKEIDIYVCAENESVNIRIKDNSVAFDPHTKIVNSDDPTINIGIRMVSKLAKEMNYQNTFGLNVLSITL